MSMSAFAASPKNVNIKATLSGQINIHYEQCEQRFVDDDGNLVLPLIYQGTTYLPVRCISNLIGYGVNWDQADYEVELSSKGTPRNYDGAVDEKDVQVDAILASELTVSLDGKKQTFTDAQGNVVYPIIYKGTTYLPIRAMGKTVNVDASWDQKTNTASLTKKIATVTTPAQPAIPAGAWFPENKEFIPFLPYIPADGTKSFGGGRYLTNRELVMLGAKNGVVIDKSESLCLNGGVSFEGLNGKFSSMTFTIRAPKDAELSYNITYGPTAFTEKPVYEEGNEPTLKPGETVTRTITIENAGVAGVGGLTFSDSVWLITDIYFS